MGARNSDRVHISEWRSKAATAADMWRQGWQVRAYCEFCAREVVVDLDRVVRLGGPGASLWDKTGRCGLVLDSGHQCLGRTFFKAVAPGASGWAFLGRELPRVRRPGHGPQSRGKGPFVTPEEVEPPAVTKARGPAPPEPDDTR